MILTTLALGLLTGGPVFAQGEVAADAERPELVPTATREAEPVVPGPSGPDAPETNDASRAAAVVQDRAAADGRAAESPVVPARVLTIAPPPQGPFGSIDTAAAPASYSFGPAIESPHLVAAAAPPSRTEVDRDLGWAGFGLRFGSAKYAVSSGLLRTEAGIVDTATDTAGQVGSEALGLPPPAPVATDHPGIRDFNSRVTTLTPSLHLGGDGYFFKIEGILGLGSDFKTIGGGLYPINYGVFIKKVGLFPYFSLGLAAHYLTGKTRNVESSGMIMQARAAAGLKWRAFGRITVSAEIGSSAVAAGIKDTRSGRTSVMGTSNLDGVGGFGKAMDFALGVELL